MLLVLSAMAFALPETRQLPPSNTMQGMLAMEEKWLLGSPLRVARGGGKRRRSRTTSVDGGKKQRRVEEKEAGPTTRRTRYHATRSSYRTLRRRSYFRVAPQRLLKSNAADYQRQSLCRSYRAHAATTKPSSAFAEGAAQRSASQWCYTREHGATVKMRQAGAKRRATSSQPRIPPSPPVGQQDTGNVVSGSKSEPTSTPNKSAAATTTPRPSLEGQRETAIISGYQHQRTAVDQPLLAATSSLSPHNEQRHVKVASGKESKKVTTNLFETTTATRLSPCVGQQESSIPYGDKDQITTLKQPLTTLTSSLSPYDGQWDTDKMSSGKKTSRTPPISL
ncbi:hypothetical protein MRX96_052484 [Rhipicephalus microplus]